MISKALEYKLSKLGHKIEACTYLDWEREAFQCSQCGGIFAIPFNYFDKAAKQWFNYNDWTCDEFIIKSVIQ